MTKHLTMEVRGTSTGNVLPGLSVIAKRKHTKNASLSLYSEHPKEEITLDEFELFALDRLQLLRGIEQVKIREGGAGEVAIGSAEDKRRNEKFR